MIFDLLKMKFHSHFLILITYLIRYYFLILKQCLGAKIEIWKIFWNNFFGFRKTKINFLSIVEAIKVNNQDNCGNLPKSLKVHFCVLLSFGNWETFVSTFCPHFLGPAGILPKTKNKESCFGFFYSKMLPSPSHIIPELSQGIGLVRTTNYAELDGKI